MNIRLFFKALRWVLFVLFCFLWAYDLLDVSPLGWSVFFIFPIDKEYFPGPIMVWAIWTIISFLGIKTWKWALKKWTSAPAHIETILKDIEDFLNSAKEDFLATSRKEKLVRSTEICEHIIVSVEVSEVTSKFPLGGRYIGYTTFLFARESQERLLSEVIRVITRRKIRLNFYGENVSGQVVSSDLFLFFLDEADSPLHS